MIGVLIVAGCAIFVGIFAAMQRPRVTYQDEPKAPEPPVEPRETAPEPVEPPPAPLPPIKKDMLEIFCTAIRDFEGKPGNQNYRFNNPGNFRFSPVGYLPKYGNVKRSSNGFAIFPTYELGWEYLKAHVRNKAEKHPNWTIRDFFYNYAPPADDNPTEAYAKNVAKRCGVSVDTRVSDLIA